MYFVDYIAATEFIFSTAQISTSSTSIASNAANMRIVSLCVLSEGTDGM